MFGWFKRKPDEPKAPDKPNLLHRWVVDVDWLADHEHQLPKTFYVVRRYSWHDDIEMWVRHANEEQGLARFDTEEEARAFIEKHAHLPAAFDIQKSYNGQ